MSALKHANVIRLNTILFAKNEKTRSLQAFEGGGGMDYRTAEDLTGRFHVLWDSLSRFYFGDGKSLRAVAKPEVSMSCGTACPGFISGMESPTGAN